MKKLIDMFTGLVRGPFRWFFGQTKIGGVLNEYKTELGFTLVALGVALDALIKILSEGVMTLPDMAILQQALTMLIALKAAIGEYLANGGAALFGIGLYDDKLKRKENS